MPMKQMDKEGPMMEKGKGDPGDRKCAMCGMKETAPDAKKPVILTVYSTELGKYMCSCCYDSMKELDEYAEPPSSGKILLALGGHDE